VWKALDAREAGQLTASRAVIAVPQNHTTATIPRGSRAVWSGDESRAQRPLAWGGAHPSAPSPRHRNSLVAVKPKPTQLPLVGREAYARQGRPRPLLYVGQAPSGSRCWI